MPTSVRASEPIRLTDDGKHVIMPVETFRNREIDLMRLEQKVKVLQDALQEERDTTDEYLAKMEELEEAINQEQQKVNELRLTNIQDKFKWLTIGLGVGIIVGIAID